MPSFLFVAEKSEFREFIVLDSEKMDESNLPHIHIALNHLAQKLAKREIALWRGIVYSYKNGAQYSTPYEVLLVAGECAFYQKIEKQKEEIVEVKKSYVDVEDKFDPEMSAWYFCGTRLYFSCMIGDYVKLISPKIKYMSFVIPVKELENLEKAGVYDIETICGEI